MNLDPAPLLHLYLGSWVRRPESATRGTGTACGETRDLCPQSEPLW